MIGSTLKELLTSRGMNVMELSKRTGISAQTIYSIIKRDNMKVDFDMLLAICRALDTPVQMFYSGTSPELPSREEWELIRKFRSLDERGRQSVELNIDLQLEYMKNAQ